MLFRPSFYTLIMCTEASENRCENNSRVGKIQIQRNTVLAFNFIQARTQLVSKGGYIVIERGGGGGLHL